ncbi:MAG TPA: ABC transporter permease [Spirochaetia bacterium]|nr:ABC transporter permease [Spirochaetia bacterium]
MKKFLAMFKARTMEFVRDRGTFFWNLLFPLLLVFGFAFAFSGNGQDLFKVGVIGKPDSSLSFMQLSQINFIYYDITSPEVSKEEILKNLRQHKIDMVIDFQSGQYYINKLSPKGPLLKRLLLADSGHPGSFPLSEQQVSGKAVRYVDWLVPGVIGMNMLFACLFGVGYVIVRYRKNGVLKRLKATPVSALNFVSAQAASRFVIVMVTSIVVYGGANLFLHFMMQGSYLNLILLTSLAIISMISLGLVFAARMKSEELANGLMNLVTFPMVVFSGVFFSLEGTPKILQKIAQVLPLTHFVNGARAIMLDGAGFTQVLPDYLYLGGVSLLFVLLASFTFKWE